MYRYYPAITLPAGSTHIVARETTPSPASYLALKTSLFQDSLNTGLAVLPSGTHHLTLAASRWTYQRLSNDTESIATSGPVDEGVVIYSLAYYEYEGITFSFNVPRTEIGNLTRTVYFWNETEWGVCDAPEECGTGTQERGVACWRAEPGGVVVAAEEGDCDALLPHPPSSRRCGTPCVYGWVASEWGQCNVSCGEGVRGRGITCHLIKDGEVGEEEVEDNLCPPEDRPEDMQTCEEGACHYDWHHGEWGSCDVPCGEGWREREVWCEQREGGVATNDETLCDTSGKPEHMGVCHTPYECSWTTSEWGEVRISMDMGVLNLEITHCSIPFQCSGSCDTGTGTQLRTISCVHQNGTQVTSQFCSAGTAAHPLPPEATRSCTPACTTPPPLPAPPPGCIDRFPSIMCERLASHNLCSRYRNYCCASCFHF